MTQEINSQHINTKTKVEKQLNA